MSNLHYPLQESVMYLAIRVSRALRKYQNQEFTRKGYTVTIEQFDVLLYLYEKGSQSQKSLGRALRKDKTTMTRLIKSVEVLNFVKRKANREDKREKLVSLTRSGKKITKELTGLTEKILNNIQKGIHPANRDITRTVLKQVHDRLSENLDQ